MSFKLNLPLTCFKYGGKKYNVYDKLLQVMSTEMINGVAATISAKQMHWI